ncbi:molybdopterin dinucleotide binding domain-containing protein, partial [Bacillus cereus]|uniref:molybdopterin dinucleotide binding domain-containing protein n=1 Tax=Bacillus cereus TaxID=1396 RepID=UPI00284FCB4F
VHFHEGNMTNKSTGIHTKVPGVCVGISPDLAKERSVKKGSVVRRVSLFGALKLRALVTDRVKANEFYLPMSSTDNETAINFLTGPAVD